MGHLGDISVCFCLWRNSVLTIDSFLPVARARDWVGLFVLMLQGECVGNKKKKLGQLHSSLNGRTGKLQEWRSQWGSSQRTRWDFYGVIAAFLLLQLYDHVTSAERRKGVLKKAYTSFREGDGRGTALPWQPRGSLKLFPVLPWVQQSLQTCAVSLWGLVQAEALLTPMHCRAECWNVHVLLKLLYKQLLVNCKHSAQIIWSGTERSRAWQKWAKLFNLFQWRLWHVKAPMVVGCW